ncbi:MAG: LamG-like jellyroll fold domain-containing protein [Bacillota bacterium]
MRFKLRKAGWRLRVSLSAAIFLLGAVLAGWAFGYGQNNNNDGLVLDIDFSEENYDAVTRTFRDKSGNNNNAVSTNAAVFAPDKDGKSEGAMAFNGNSDEVVTTYDFTAQQDITYSVWFNRLGSTGLRTFFGSDSNNGTVRLNNSVLQVYWDPTTASLNSGVTISGQQWHQLVVVKTSGQLTVYLDGSYLWGTAVSNIGINNIKFGNQGAQTVRFWGGVISNARIYERAFSQIEVSKLYNEFKPKYQISSIEKGLIGYWPLDENNFDPSSGRVTDISGYGNHGTNMGGTITNDRAGKSGGAMHFNGVDSKIAINYANPVKQTSVVAWFKKTGEPAGGYHIITGASAVEVSIYTSGFLRTGVVTDAQARQVFNSGSGLTDGKWHMVGLTYDGTSLKSWIDGQVTATNPVSGNLLGVAREIGRYQTNTYVTNGDIADVRIYNRALSAGEMSLLYSSYNPPATGDSLSKGLVVDQPLYNKYKNGGYFTDRGGYTNSAKIYGTPVYNQNNVDLNSNAFVEVAHNDSIDTEELSVSFWALYRDFVYPKTIAPIKKSSPQCYNTGGKGWDFGHSYAAQAINVCINDGVNRYWGSLYLNSPNASALNKWTHYALVVDRSADRIYAYVNGVKQTSESNISAVTGSIRNNGNLSIGQVYGWTTDGLMSDFKMYNRPLSASEVKTLYDRGRGNSGAVLNGL